MGDTVADNPGIHQNLSIMNQAKHAVILLKA